MDYTNTRTRLAPHRKGLKLDKSSIYNLFEKASAEAGLGMNTEAKADLQSVISLTEKNRNTAERASIYAKIAALESRQQQWSDAQSSLQSAIALDPNNADLYILQGDIYTSSGNFRTPRKVTIKQLPCRAISPVLRGREKLKAMVKMNQAKYGTRMQIRLLPK